MNHKVNFDKLVERVRTPLIGKDELSIWGGECDETQVLAFLQQWPTLERMPYRIWMYSSDIVFEHETLPGNVQWLERGRLFGKDGGDLSLRRDGNRFRWWFVGPTGTHPPNGYEAKDFWEAELDAMFHRYEATALLWGEGKPLKREDDAIWQWFEDRVAGAALIYPVNGHPKRVQVEYRAYSRAGRVEFVWFIGLSEWKEAE